MLMLMLYKRVEYSGQIRMVKEGKHLVLSVVRFGWIATNIGIYVLEEQSSSSRNHGLGTPKS